MSLVTTELVQELRASMNLISGNVQYAWYQDGVAQHGGYVPRGSKLLRNSGPFPTIADDLAATYDIATGTLTWETPQAYGAQPQVWTRIGSLPRLPAQELAFQPGHGNSVLYLLLEGGASALASRGPGQHASCMAKLIYGQPRPTMASTSTPGTWSIFFFLHARLA